MNKLIISNGGHNVRNEDILLVQESMREGFLAMLSPLGTFFIIQGCTPTISASSLTITPGYICINGEIYFYLGKTIPYNPAHYYYFKPSVTPTGTRIYFDSSVHDTREIRIASTVVMTSPDPTGYDVLNNDKYSYLIQRESLDLIGEILAPWVADTVGVIGLYLGSPGTFTVVTANINYKRIGKTLLLNYDIELLTTGSSAQLAALQFSLPAVLQPISADRKTATAFFNDSTSGTLLAFSTAANPGTVRIQLASPQTYSSGVTLYVRGQIMIEIA